MRLVALALLLALPPAGALAAPPEEASDVADVPFQERKIAGPLRYFLIGAGESTESPEEGYGLVLVLPGGDGGEDFHAFVQRIWKHALPEGYLVAQLVSVKWRESQRVVWPTQRNPVPGMKLSTEAFASHVLRDVSKRHRIDSGRVFTLAWSSGGPAAYALSLANPKVRGSYIAMSVFKPEQLPSLKRARGHAYYLLQSPGDRVTPYRFAEAAKEALGRRGAEVELASYEGGHGWRGDVYGRLRRGFRWLEERTGESSKSSEDSGDSGDSDDSGG